MLNIISREEAIEKAKQGLSFYEIYGDDPRDCDFYTWPGILREAGRIDNKYEGERMNESE